MEKYGYKEAIKILTDAIKPTETEMVLVEEVFSRVIAEDIKAAGDVPDFDRSPYDGYAFKASDTQGAGEKKKVTLKVIENIRAGQCAKNEVKSGTAIRLMTGAPVPDGADAIAKYEDTEFTDEEVTLKKEYRPGENIIYAGEDIKKGTLTVRKGTRADAPVMGVLSSLGTGTVPVYKRPVAALISTGDEVVDNEDDLMPGKIRNSNRYTMAGALKHIGIESIYAGLVKDDVQEIRKMILSSEEKSDVIISTGGVSAGDYDLVPQAMEEAGYEIVIKNIAIKPGMACAYGVKNGRLMLALSGNPASSLTNLQCICYPALRKLAGLKEYEHKIIKMRLKNDLKKGGKGVRFIRGIFSIEDGQAVFESPKEQGNVVISSAVLCNAYACVPEGSSPFKAEEIIEGFMI